MPVAYGIGGLIQVPPGAITTKGVPQGKGILGQTAFDVSDPANPVEYVWNGIEWATAGANPATTTTYGTVLLTDNSEPVATKAYADNLAIAGAPVSTTTTAGIGQLATDAEAIAGTASTPALALFVTPSNLAPVFASPPAIGGTTPAAGTFAALTATTGHFTGLLTADASATITTGATALNLASDASTGAVNIGTGAGARTITIGGSGANIISIGDSQTGGSISLGNALTSGTINIGSTGAGTGTMTIAGGTGAQTINIANSTGGKTVNIATGAGANTVSIGSTNTTSTTNINSGSGNVNVTGGHLSIASVAKTLLVNGGAVTDFIGTGVLTAGTQTIANTNIAAGDVILITRTAVNASTTLGVLTYTISAGVSFTVTSVILGTPGSTQTGDVSSYAYFIVRPT